MKRTLALRAAILAALLVLPLTARQAYRLPPQEIVDILDAPPPPDLILSPDGNTLLLAERSAHPPLADLARPVHRLAGLRMSPDLNSRQLIWFITGITTKNLIDGSSKRLELPDGLRISSLRWSPDSRRFAFTAVTDNGLELWSAEPAAGKAGALSPARVNAVFGDGFVWKPGGRHLLAALVVDNRGNPPLAPRAPSGPNIQETRGKVVKAATYQDLLRTPFDEALFEFYASAQLAEIDALTGAMRLLGSPAILSGFEPSPDGKHALVTRLKKPFSYSVPAYSFARSYEVWDADGTTEFVLADLPPAEEVPIAGVPTGPRSPQWQPNRPAALIWVEALDGGDPEREAPFRDRIMSLSAPFREKPRETARTKLRFAGLAWLGSKDLALLTEYDWKKSRRTTSLLDAARPGSAPRTVFDLNARDDYNNPGRPVMSQNLSGQWVAPLDGDWIYLSGEGASPQGSRPFLDRLNIRNLEKKRVFQSAPGRHETFLAFQGGSRRLMLVRSESQTDPPNCHRVDVRTGQRWRLTDYADPAPALAGLTKRLVKYKRADGLDLSGILYLPPGYEQGTKLPAVVWAYPLEYTDAAVAGQVRSSPNRFTFFRGASHLFFLLRGYAVFDGAEMPIVGDPKTVNDTFVEQLEADARAAVEALQESGAVDTTRLGVGGHSYGAFMTANLLAHTDLFAAGIARSGAYNRTLTPFGFQSERRTLWEAPESYIRMSPFMHAPKINEPILLIHGEADNNSGTFPIQSERLFAALQGFGATARLVLLPLESHGYAARESVLHALAEMLDWFDFHVKEKKTGRGTE